MADPLQPGSQPERKRGRSDYREFFNVVSRIVAENPDAIAALEEHLQRYDRAALVGGSLTAATTQHQEIINSFLQTDAGRSAAETLGEAYQRLAGQVRRSERSGSGEQQIVPVIIGGLIILDIVIWGCVFTDCI